MASHFGVQLRQLRTQRQILQSTFAERCRISSAYLSDIERGKRNPPNDPTILEWSRLLDSGNAEEIGDRLVAAAARDRGQVETVAETVAVGEDEVGAHSGTPFLDHFQRDLVDEARRDKLDPAPGRRQVIDEIAVVTVCRHRNSAVLIGDSSSEIRGIVHALACAIATGTAPESLKGTRMITVDGLQAGVKYRGQLEERVGALVKEAKTVGDVLLYFHSLADVVDLENSLNGSVLRPALEDGTLRVLTGVTAEMSYCRKLTPRLVDCFTPIRVIPLDRDSVLRGLFEIRERYGKHHGVSYSEESLVAIVDAVEEHVSESFWQQAVYKLDEVGARVRMEGKKQAIEVGDVDRFALT
jgi:ATP-dependent Clp protease ATP-binding subunit ClpC